MPQHNLRSDLPLATSCCIKNPVRPPIIVVFTLSLCTISSCLTVLYRGTKGSKIRYTIFVWLHLKLSRHELNENFTCSGEGLPGGVSAQGRVSACQGVSSRGSVCVPEGCPYARGCLPGGCLPGGGGVSVHGGCLPGGKCLLRWCLPGAGGCLPARGVSDRHSPMDKMTDACKSITLPQLRCRR